jgi:hypothetical protein
MLPVLFPPMKPRRFLLLVLLCAPVGIAIWLWRVPDFVSIPEPAENYQKAIEKFRAIEKAESALPLCPEGRSRLLTQGHKTERVFVLLHGLTNCPEQFIPLARILHASGANVVLPRARYAGFADRINAVQGLQSGQDLLDQAAIGLDIASGLGDYISGRTTKRRRLSPGHPMPIHAWARVAWPIPSNSPATSATILPHTRFAPVVWRYLPPPATRPPTANRPTNSPHNGSEKTPDVCQFTNFPRLSASPHDMIDPNLRPTREMGAGRA